MCGPSCQCTNCRNTVTTQSNEITDQQLAEIREQARNEDDYLDEFSDFLLDSDDETVQFDEEVDEIMEQLFGLQ